VNSFDFTFTPYTGNTPTPLQNQIQTTFLGSTRFTYDHDGNAATPGVYTSGMLATGVGSLYGQPIPTVLGNTTQSDGTVNGRLTMDAEGFVLDTRAGRAGTGWVSDEYGPYIYHFNASKQIDGLLRLPEALVPHSPTGTTNFFADPPTNGRRINQGMEGIAQSPSGNRLFGLLAHHPLLGPLLGGMEIGELPSEAEAWRPKPWPWQRPRPIAQQVLGEVITHLVARFPDGAQVLTAQPPQACGGHQGHEGGGDGALEQSLEPATPLVIEPGLEAGFTIAQGLGKPVLELTGRFAGAHRHGDGGIALQHLGHTQGRAEGCHLIEQLTAAVAVPLQLAVNFRLHTPVVTKRIADHQRHQQQISHEKGQQQPMEKLHRQLLAATPRQIALQEDQGE
jgi:hypothetical protein